LAPQLLTTPPWAVQGAATFVGLLDEGQHPMPVDGVVDTSWVGHVPELNPSLTPAPYGGYLEARKVCPP